MLYNTTKPQALNITSGKARSAAGLGRHFSAREIKSFAGAGNKLLKSNGETRKGLAGKISRHADR